MADNDENENWLVVVNVWDADREGAGNPKHIIGRLSSRQLDEGPFDQDQIYVPSAQYYVCSAGYDIFGDLAIVPDAVQSVTGSPYDLIAPGEGPALAIRTGHEGCWISLRIAPRQSEPAPDLARWEAVEQATIQPVGELRVRADLVAKAEDHYPDLRGGHDTGYLTIRVCVRGRNRPGQPASRVHPRRVPLEDHLIEAWPVAEPAPRVVLRRDQLSG